MLPIFRLSLLFTCREFWWFGLVKQFTKPSQVKSEPQTHRKRMEMRRWTRVYLDLLHTRFIFKRKDQKNRRNTERGKESQNVVYVDECVYRFSKQSEEREEFISSFTFLSFFGWLKMRILTKKVVSSADSMNLWEKNMRILRSSNSWGAKGKFFAVMMWCIFFECERLTVNALFRQA